MTWTYTGTPGTSTAEERRDAVRDLVGDTDTSDQQSTDESIAFALGQTRDNVFGAASIICRQIAAKYARLVATSVDGASQALGERQKHYNDLALDYANLAKEGAAGILPTPHDGLVSTTAESDIEAVFSIGMHDRTDGGVTTLEDLQEE